ncbi:hypothetical protein Hanom_Chr07g00627501 [Helianthus anomalus]
MQNYLKPKQNRLCFHRRCSPNTVGSLTFMGPFTWSKPLFIPSYQHPLGVEMQPAFH